MTTQERIDAGILHDRRALPPIQKSLEGVREDAEELHFSRERDSHRGFSRLTHLTLSLVRMKTIVIEGELVRERAR